MASCINISPWKPFIPTPDVQTVCWRCSSSPGCCGPAWHKGATRVHEERAMQDNQSEWVLKALDLDALLGFQNFP